MSLSLYGLKSIQDLVAKTLLYAVLHPDTDVTKFIEYLESVLSKVDEKQNSLGDGRF